MRAGICDALGSFGSIDNIMKAISLYAVISSGLVTDSIRQQNSRVVWEGVLGGER